MRFQLINIIIIVLYYSIYMCNTPAGNTKYVGRGIPVVTRAE